MTLTAVPGITVVHWHNLTARTGCTVVLCPEAGCVASGDVRGSAPGTRETVLLEPEETVEWVHAVVLAGGSTFGLAAATGVMRYLSERGRGFPTPFGPVPVVPGAVIYDLSVGDSVAFPDAEVGYRAAAGANSAVVLQGRGRGGCDLRQIPGL